MPLRGWRSWVAPSRRPARQIRRPEFLRDYVLATEFSDGSAIRNCADRGSPYRLPDRGVPTTRRSPRGNRGGALGGKFAMDRNKKQQMALAPPRTGLANAP